MTKRRPSPDKVTEGGSGDKEDLTMKLSILALMITIIIGTQGCQSMKPIETVSKGRFGALHGQVVRYRQYSHFRGNGSL
jgi:hypothetical protein